MRDRFSDIVEKTYKYTKNIFIDLQAINLILILSLYAERYELGFLNSKGQYYFDKGVMYLSMFTLSLLFWVFVMRAIIKKKDARRLPF